MVVKPTINYRGISLLSTTYKRLSNIFLSNLTPYVDDFIEDHQCGFRRSRSSILRSSDTGETRLEVCTIWSRLHYNFKGVLYATSRLLTSARQPGE
jgi:hypothetical protein